MKPHILTALAIAGIWSVGTRGFETEEEATDDPAVIGVVDVVHVLRHDIRVSRGLVELETIQHTALTKLERLREKLPQLEALRAEYKVSSPDYEQIETDMIKLKAKIDVERELARNRYNRIRAKTFDEAYQRIKQVVEELWQERGLSVVLNVSRDEFSRSFSVEDYFRFGHRRDRHELYWSRIDGPEDPYSPERVNRLFRQDVVANDPQVDLTELVIQRLNAEPIVLPNATTRRNENESSR